MSYRPTITSTLSNGTFSVGPSRLLPILVFLLFACVLGLYFPLYTLLAGNVAPDIYVFVVMIVLGLLIAATINRRYVHFSILLSSLPLLGFYCRPWHYRILHMVDGLLILVVLSAMAFGLGQHGNRLYKPKIKGLMKGLAVWLAAWLFLGFFGVDPVAAFLGVLRLFPLFLIAGALYLAEDKGRDPAILMRGIRIALLISLFFVGMQILFGVGFSFYPSLNLNVGIAKAVSEQRYPGPMHDPQAFGQLLSVLILLCFFWARTDRPFMNYGLAVLGFACMLFAGSRAPVIGLICGAIVASLVGKRSRSLVVGAAVLILIVSVVTTVSDFGDILLIRRFSQLEMGAEVRLSIWTRSLAIFQAYPVTGIGFDNFPTVVLKFDPAAFWFTASGPEVFDHPESTYLKILVETGAVGSTVFICILLLSLKTYVISIRKHAKDDQKRMFLMGAFSAYISLLVGLVTVYSLWDHRILFLLGFLGILPYFFVPEKRMLA